MMDASPEPAPPTDAAFAEISQLASHPSTAAVPRLAALWRQAEAAGQPWHRAFALAALAKNSFVRDADEALAMGRQALLQMQQLGTRRGRALAHTAIGLSHRERGEVAEALTHLEQALELERAAGDASGQAHSLANLTAVLERVGRRDAAMECLEEALDLLPAVPGADRGLRLVLQNNLAAALASRARADRDEGGDRAVWAADAERALAVADGLLAQPLDELQRLLRNPNYPRGCRAKALVVLDRLDEALPLLQELQTLYAAAGDNYALLYAQVELARAHLQRGAPAQARDLAREAIALAQQRHFVFFLEPLWAVLAQAHEALGELAPALAAFKAFHRLKLQAATLQAEELARSLAVRLDTARAQRESRRDALTGLLNRRGFDELLAAQLARATYAHPVTLLLIDVDHFKAVNDQHGHARGDEVLALLAQLLRLLARSGDQAARLGGDELAWFGQLDAAAAQPVAERLRQALRHETATRWPGQPPLTVSIGIAEAREPEAAAALVQRADAALYAAKAAGRDAVRLAATPSAG